MTKPTKSGEPAKAQANLCWIGDTKLLHAYSEDFDSGRNAGMRRTIWVFAGRKYSK